MSKQINVNEFYVAVDEYDNKHLCINRDTACVIFYGSKEEEKEIQTLFSNYNNSIELLSIMITKDLENQMNLTTTPLTTTPVIVLYFNHNPYSMFRYSKSHDDDMLLNFYKFLESSRKVYNKDKTLNTQMKKVVKPYSYCVIF